ncbi:type IV pilin protein [Alysiella filiformis]|uniref:Prepilin-type N-terminal cleavage/methylation domain-containing protein n=2 Tax=Alysiella TaxID=194195 RepID=A0A286E250_9NEIS|nr:type IV pilin protein [Alysiella filiformis]QMT32519.1 prepilin-type N-terminal cleavage/methylation domain-containing protein [Alysiella filiformis]UBQ56170.1 prepilin-type N-terminal cleavage/methylation domain-containing protein [Alysiella filiformis DSM 16848]SOD64962.1 prepilin-type N-terminal cleavage/methylation domain-containing protein [Alysiella filiformis DSM 16848]
MKTPLSQRGFTLAQMLVVMGILAVLTAIAYPSYVNYVKNGRLNDAQRALIINAQNLEQHRNKHHSYKKNSTTWADLSLNATSHFCIKMQGNARGANDDKFTIKAVAFNKNHEPRVLSINQDHMLMICENSESSCDTRDAVFKNTGRSDTNCRIIN